MKKLKWGVIGCGNVAKRFMIPAIQRSCNGICTAVMSRTEESVQETMDEHKIPFGTTVLSSFLQQDIDAVYIASPVHLHAEQACAAAEAGKHILLEKPMGLTPEEVDRILSCCKKNNVTLIPGFMMRYHGAHQRTKQLISEGVIGEIRSIHAVFHSDYTLNMQQWRLNRGVSGGGPLMDMGIHCIDLMQFVTGQKIVKVCGKCSNDVLPNVQVEDTCKALMQLSGGAQFILDTNCVKSWEEDGSSFEIVGTKGCIKGWRTFGMRTGGKLTLIANNGEEKDIDFSLDDMYLCQAESFADAVINDKLPAITAEEGLNAQKIVAAIYESSRSNREMTI